MKYTVYILFLKGAYGEVKLVQHAKSKTLFALKIINKAFINYQSPIEIFLREISVHKSLTHPNIAKLYDHLEDRNNIYLVLEYVEKGSLYELLKKKVQVEYILLWEHYITVILDQAYCSSVTKQGEQRAGTVLLNTRGTESKTAGTVLLWDKRNRVPGQFC